MFAVVDYGNVVRYVDGVEGQSPANTLVSFALLAVAYRAFARAIVVANALAAEGCLAPWERVLNKPRITSGQFTFAYTFGLDGRTDFFWHFDGFDFLLFKVLLALVLNGSQQIERF